MIIPTPGPLELLVVLTILLLLFGPDKLPKLANSVGRAMGELKKGREEAEEEFEQFKN